MLVNNNRNLQLCLVFRKYLISVQTWKIWYFPILWNKDIQLWLIVITPLLRISYMHLPSKTNRNHGKIYFSKISRSNPNAVPAPAPDPSPIHFTMHNIDIDYFRGPLYVSWTNHLILYLLILFTEHPSDYFEKFDGEDDHKRYWIWSNMKKFKSCKE